MLLLALALGTFQIAVSDSCGAMIAILLLHVCGALAGASLGTVLGHPLVFGGISTAAVLPTIFVIKVFNC